LTSAGAASSAWWLLMISIGNAGMALSYHSRMQPRKVVQLLPRYTSLSRYSALLAIIVVATALVFRVAGLQRRDLDAAFITIGISVIFAASTALIVASSHDVNVLRTLTGMATTLLRQSRTDALTGLPNRRALDERLQAEIHRSASFNHPLSVGLIDIDDFKSINDQLGHQAGDAVLRQFSEALERELRSIDVVGRFGGEEFLMILPETASEGAWIAADRLLRSIREQSRIDGLPGRAVTASIGLASFPVDGRSAKTLLAASDRALYAAKRAGKNQIALAQRQ
ncbi:MAG: GGDEF domain-containing protein, partial [Thermomicrobiales bacterium]